jgi:hypothetical protein
MFFKTGVVPRPAYSMAIVSRPARTAALRGMVMVSTPFL